MAVENHSKIFYQYKLLQQGLDILGRNRRRDNPFSKSVLDVARDLRSSVEQIPDGKQVVRDIASIVKMQRLETWGTQISEGTITQIGEKTPNRSVAAR
jgi:hypothetical protein